MKQLDTFLIERVFEPWSHWSERHFDKNNFQLARLLLRVSVISNIAEIFFVPIARGILFLITGLAWICILEHHIPRYEEVAKRNAIQGLKNPLQDSEFFTVLRFIWTCLAPLSFLVFYKGETLLALVTLTTWGCFHFMACTPLPPRPKYEAVPDAVTA